MEDGLAEAKNLMCEPVMPRWKTPITAGLWQLEIPLYLSDYSQPNSFRISRSVDMACSLPSMFLGLGRFLETRLAEG